MNRFVDDDLDWLVEVRDEEKDWDESKHPRVPAGSPEGGQFGSGGGVGEAGGGEGKGEYYDVKPQAEVMAVGGDRWNKDTA